MQIPNITYYDFIRLDNDEQSNWINILRYGEPIEVDCTTWKYGDVKTVQQLLTKELTEDGFDYILKLVFKKGYMYIPFHIVLLTYRDWETDRKSTRLNSSHSAKSRMPSSA